MDNLIITFLVLYSLTKMNCQINSQWVSIYNGVYEARNLYCNNINCIYGFKNFATSSSAKFINCTSQPQTAIVLDSFQSTIIQNQISLSPSIAHVYKIVIFDVFFTSQWADDVIEINYDNQIYQKRYTTQNPLYFSQGFCDSKKFEIKTFYQILPYTSNTPSYLILQISNSLISALIRNIHISLLSCYPNCLQCTGPSQLECSVWGVIYNRCPIRKSMLSNGQCVDHCPISGSIVKSQNRICVGFQHTQFFYSNLAALDLTTLLNWNIIYDPLHLDISNKKVSPYNYGVFHHREGIQMGATINSGNYTIGAQIQIVFCNSTPPGSGIYFSINSKYYGSTYYDGSQFKFDNVILKNLVSYANIGKCTNNIFMELEMFYHIFDTKFIFQIQGNFNQPNVGWFLRLFSLTSGFCPINCIQCNQRYKCETCASGFLKVSDGTCVQNSCPPESLKIGQECIYYNQVTKYSKYLIREFYDFTVKDTLNSTFIVESSVVTDFQKGADILWSYLTNKVIFGGKFVWAQSRFSQIYTLDPHHSLTIYFQVIFGPNFPALSTNYFSYEINNGTQKQIYTTSSLSVIEYVSTYNPTLTIAVQCYGIDVIDSYCGISNYYIVVHYCKSFCNRCSNELTCDEWRVYDPNIIKAEQSQCLSDQFLDETTFTCENCPFECLTCFNEYECLTCKTNYRLSFTTCIQDCQINQYYDGTNCLNCDYTCKQCQSNAVCINCESKFLRYLENGQCKCYDGYYDQNNIQQCQPCDKLCSKCNGSTNKNCQECILLNNLILNGDTCECEVGYYFDEFQLKCLKCQSKCEKCFNNTEFSCLTCYSTQLRILDGFNCKCQNGYYDINQDICIQCPSLEDVSLAFCYKVCGNGSTIWFNQNCPNVICPSGYNNVNNLCQPICGDMQIVTEEQCDDGNLIQFDGCHNCRFQCSPQCITPCNTATVFSCPDVCGDGIVSGLEECDDSNSIQSDSCYQCKFKCQPQCTSCIRGDCYECLTFGWVLEPFTKKCIETCGDKYYVGNEQCEEMNSLMLDGCYNCRFSCQKSCLICTINGCMSCQAGYKLVNHYCRNICGDSIIVDEEDCDDGNLYPFDTCHQCVYQCQQECLNCVQGNCVFCINGFEPYDGECVEIYTIPTIPFNEQYKDQIIEFCKTLIFGICYECHQGYILNNICNICELDKGKQIIKFQNLETLPQFIQYCLIQINNLCIICLDNYQLDKFTNDCQPICGDGILSGTEECEDFNHQVLDGCYQCKYQCSQNCEICEFGRCTLCQLNSVFVPKTFQCQNIQLCNEPGGYYNQETNQCYSICGDGLKYLNEECDDGNNIEYDGCHKCQFSCEPGCKCIKGECFREEISCNLGFYFSFNTLSCIPLCGDGITINPFEECDDGNEIIDDECHLCKLQCSIACQICSTKNICLECKEGYELINYKCENLNNQICDISNCEFCQNYECLTCFNGYYLNDYECISLCGDGIVANIEECDDGNLINGDGCNDDCTKSNDTTCRFNECIILNHPYPILLFEKESFGIQYLNLRYNTQMKLIHGFNQKDYLDNLFFEIDNYTDVALFQVTTDINITQELQFLDIKISVQFLKNLENPILNLKFLDKNILVNQEEAQILEDFIRIRLRSSNILSDQQQRAVSSVVRITDYNAILYLNNTL